MTILEVSLFLIGTLLLITLIDLGLRLHFFYNIQQELPTPIHLSVINYKYYLSVLVAVVVVVQDK